MAADRGSDRGCPVGWAKAGARFVGFAGSRLSPG